MRRQETVDVPAVAGSTSTPDADDHPSAIYQDAARHFLDVQFDIMNTLDARVAQYLSVASFALPVTFALLNLGSGQDRDIPEQAIWALLASLLAYIAVLGCAAIASRQRALEYRPNLSTLRAYSETYNGIQLRQWIANEYEASVSANQQVVQRKATWVGAEALAFYIEGFCLSLAAVGTVLL